MRLHRTLIPIVFTLFLLFWPALVQADFQAGVDAYESSEKKSVQSDLNQWIQSAITGDEKARTALATFFERELQQWKASTTGKQRRRGVAVKKCVPFPYEPQLRAWAKTDDPDGQFYMGRWHYIKGGFNADAGKSWYQKAAKGGHAEAQYRLAAHTSAKQLPWLRASAEQGFPPAQVLLGTYCYSGRTGVLQSFEQAAVWWGKAAAGGDPDALWNLGLLHAAGEGVPKNKKRALELFRKAAWASKHSQWYQYKLGQLFEQGIAFNEGVPAAVEGFTPDLIQAHAWYNLANTQGVSFDYRDRELPEQRGLARVTKKLTPEQIAEAQRLAREWLAQHQK